MDTLYNEIENWMVTYKKTSVKKSTYDRLYVSLKTLGNNPISDVPVDKLTSDDIQRYVNYLVDNDYALSTIKKQYHLIGEFLSFCSRKRLIFAPIHEDVKLPLESNVLKHKREVMAYSDAEQEALRSVLERGDSPVFYADILMLETGMRVGEVVAIGWNDVDWRRKAIRIHKTAVNLGGSRESFVQEGAKSVSSNRTIALSKEAFRMLSYLKEIDDSDCGFIFHDEYGRHLTYEAVRWWTRKACNEAGVQYYGCHVFRHTFATNCYNKGCDVKVLSRFLGHSDVTITYNIYIHLFGDALEEMRSIVG